MSETDTPHDLGGETDIVTDDASLPADGPTIRKFAIPSLLGILTFLTPVRVDGNWTILMGWISDSARDYVGPDRMPWVVFALLVVSALGTVGTILAGRANEGSLAYRLFHVSPVWVVLRCLGLVMGTMTMFQIGPELFWEPATGGTVLNDLATNIVPIFLFAGLLMPFLTDYGLMEFIGTLLKGIFRRLFTLPGRSAIDALASWMSSAPVGVLITIQQYVSDLGHRLAALSERPDLPWEFHTLDSITPVGKRPLSPPIFPSCRCHSPCWWRRPSAWTTGFRSITWPWSSPALSPR